MSTSMEKFQGRHSFAARYGVILATDGIAAIPMALFAHQEHLQLSAQEVWFTSYILAHKWDDRLPHPSLVRMATASGLDVSQLHRIKNSLIHKGFLTIVARYNRAGGREANDYDFSPLFRRLEDLVRQGAPPEQELKVDEAEPSLNPQPPQPHPRPVTAPASPRQTTAHASAPSRAGCDPPEESDSDPPDAPAPLPPVEPLPYPPMELAPYPPVAPLPHPFPQKLALPSLVAAPYPPVELPPHEEEADSQESDSLKTDPPESSPPSPPIRSPGWVGEGVDDVGKRIEADTRALQACGLGARQAAHLARLAVTYNQPAGYVAEQIAYVRSRRDVRNPLAMLVATIQRNESRPGPARPRVALPAQRDAPASTPPIAESALESNLDQAAWDEAQEAFERRQAQAIERARLWQQAELLIRPRVAEADYLRVIRYLRFLELDRTRGWALLGTPTPAMRDRIRTHLQPSIEAALSQVCGRPIQILPVVLPGLLDPPLPPLADLLGRQTDQPADWPGGAPLQPNRSLAPEPADQPDASTEEATRAGSLAIVALEAIAGPKGDNRE